MPPETSSSEFIVVLTTCDSQEAGERIASALVEERLAACVNVVPGVRSCFRWQGELRQEHECLVVVKSRAARFPELSQRIRELHSYDLPEIIALPVVGGSEDYLRWLAEAVAN